jgi:hypothetical protein
MSAKARWSDPGIVMQFPRSSADSVKSISQRALLAYWDRVAAGRRFPSLDEFNPEQGIHDPRQLVFWRIEGEQKAPRFRALYQGSNISDGFAAQWAGKTLDEIVPDFARYFVLMSARECAMSGCAIYTVLRTRDANNNEIDCDRLLLPLGRGAVAEQMVASIQLASPRAEFRREAVLGNFKSRIDLVCACAIQTSPAPVASWSMIRD